MSHDNFFFQVSHIKEHGFTENVMSEIIQGNDFEAAYGAEAAQNVNTTKYDALNTALDIESFHVFVDYLIKRGPGGGHDGTVWDVRQKHWRYIIAFFSLKLFSYLFNS